MAEIADVELAVDFIGKEKSIDEIQQSNSRLKVGKILPEENIDLLFAVDDGGVRIPLRKLMLCPFNGLKICKLQRCLAYDDNNSVCTLFQNNQGHKKYDRSLQNENEKRGEINPLDLVDALHKKHKKMEDDSKKGIPSQPNLPSFSYSQDVLTDGY